MKLMVVIVLSSEVVTMTTEMWMIDITAVTMRGDWCIPVCCLPVSLVYASHVSVYDCEELVWLDPASHCMGFTALLPPCVIMRNWVYSMPG